MEENKERNRNDEFDKVDVLSVSGDYGIVNQIQLLGRSFAGSSVRDYHIVRKGNIVYTKSPLKEYPYGIVKVNKGNEGIVSTLYAVYNVKQNALGDFIESYFALPKRTNRYFKPIVRIGAKHDMKIGNEEAIANIVCFPSYAEQRKISAFISLLNERISIQSRIIEKYETLIKGIRNLLLYSNEGRSVRLGDILIERFEKTKLHNQYKVLSSTVKGIFSQREYFSKDIASGNNAGYKIIRLYDVVLSPQNLWMGNINYNDKFEIGIVSPSYKIYSIAKSYDKRFVEAMLKTHRALYNYILVSEQGASIVRRNLNLEAFYELTFKIPPIEKQEKIGNVISALQSRLEAAVNFKTAYELQKQYLLSQMFI